jgi:hypothetical protein
VIFGCSGISHSILVQQLIRKTFNLTEIVKDASLVDGVSTCESKFMSSHSWCRLSVHTLVRLCVVNNKHRYIWYTSSSVTLSTESHAQAVLLIR